MPRRPSRNWKTSTFPSNKSEKQKLHLRKKRALNPLLIGSGTADTAQKFRTLGSLNREQGISMLVVEQNASLALGIANRGYVLETGSIVVSGSADELSRNDDVRKAYLGF